MGLLLAVGLALLGLAAIVIGIVALRDDAPRWTLKIKRPGWLLTLGVVSLVFAWLVNASRYNIERDVTEVVGQEVDCENVGALIVEGESRDVYACIGPGDAHLGCFVRAGDGVVDVSLRAEEEGTGEEVKPDC